VLYSAADSLCARQDVDDVGTTHHAIGGTLADLRAALPAVTYHREAFEALLVRSSVTNYLAARYASGYVESVLSGEGADELFGGYAYLKDLSADDIPVELFDITRRLHNTALQRVDRSASAHELVAHVPFLDTEVVRYAMTIPSEMKIRRNGSLVEKWVLRKAGEDVLPDDVLWRTKSKFWQGAGVGDLLAQHAEASIADDEFRRERHLANGWTL